MLVAKVEQEGIRSRQLLQPSDSSQSILQPALMKYEDKSYSLEPDMVNGWRPRRKLYRQIPVRTVYPAVDLLVKEYTKFGAAVDYRVIYMGYRPASNLQLIRQHCWRQYDHNCKEALLYGLQKLRRYQFTYSRQKERPLGDSTETRLFAGMNPTVESDQLIFDSEFECGNLDLVMKVATNEYDLFMRVDTNTRGHNSWFMFKCRNTRAGLKVKLNICNFHRSSSLFSQGMRPSVFSRLGSRNWEHGGTNITYTRSQLRYPVCQDITGLWCLSFQYIFEKDFDEVYFSYSVPYSYSFLMNFLEELSRPPQTKRFLRISYLLESPGGLSIPVLTISNPSDDREKKKIVLVTARLHPGQPQGSWTLHGFLKFLCSEDGNDLRNRVIFKIMPMVNVDGVVAGNFRTGLLGLDLNRLFRKNTEQQYYEVEYIKELARAYQDQTLLYLDFHGHSTRKNVFIYGPDYKMNDGNYMLCRILPKSISKLTDTFRYYSCIFKISKHKETTGRAVMLRQFGIPFCYTVESSAYSYVSSRGQVPFTSELYQRSGEGIGEGITKYIKLLTKIEIRREEIRREKKRAKELKIQVYKEVQIVQIQRRVHRSKRKVGEQNSKKKVINSLLLPEGIDELDELMKDIREDEALMDAHNSQEESSDCQKEEDDYQPQQLTEFMSKSLAAAATKQPKQVLGGSSNLKRNHIYMSMQKVKDQNSEILEKSISPKNRVIIRDFVEEFKTGNRKMISNRSIHYEKSTEDLLPEIKSSRPLQKRAAQSVGHHRQDSRGRPSRWASNYAMRQPITTHVAQLKMETLQPKRNPSIEQYDNKLVVRQGCIVNLRIDSQSEHSSEEPNEQQTNFAQGRFPEVRRDARRKRRLEIVDGRQQASIPDVISDILRRHMPSQRNQPLQKSIQILRL